MHDPSFAKRKWSGQCTGSGRCTFWQSGSRTCRFRGRREGLGVAGANANTAVDTARQRRQRFHRYRAPYRLVRASETDKASSLSVCSANRSVSSRFAEVPQCRSAWHALPAGSRGSLIPHRSLHQRIDNSHWLTVLLGWSGKCSVRLLGPHPHPQHSCTGVVSGRHA